MYKILSFQKIFTEVISLVKLGLLNFFLALFFFSLPLIYLIKNARSDQQSDHTAPPPQQQPPQYKQANSFASTPHTFQQSSCKIHSKGLSRRSHILAFHHSLLSSFRQQILRCRGRGFGRRKWRLRSWQIIGR